MRRLLLYGAKEPVPREYIDYQLCKMFSCLPSQLEKENHAQIRLFEQFIVLEDTQRRINQQKNG